jgi:hypothetical protein
MITWKPQELKTVPNYKEAIPHSTERRAAPVLLFVVLTQSLPGDMLAK